MALPTIIIDSATGSDTAASGAGPGDGTTSGSALTGTSASTDGAGTLVTLDGSPDLTNVATDGSHVIYLADSTAGKRNFSKITAKDNSAKTVTVSDAFDVSLSGKSWAIGGKRASIGGTNSRKLFNNNSANGDAMPGWIVEMQSGHTETNDGIRQYRDGDGTDGPVWIRGAAGAATRPVYTISSGGTYWNLDGVSNFKMSGFEITATGTTPDRALYVPDGSASVSCRIEDMILRGSFSTGVVMLYGPNGNGASVSVAGCLIHNTGAGVGIYNYFASAVVVGCEVISDNNTGIYSTGSTLTAISNIIHDCGGAGVSLNLNNAGTLHLIANTIDNNASHGFAVTNNTISSSWLLNNIITNNGGYGVSAGAGGTDAFLRGRPIIVAGNVFYGNTSGDTSPTWTFDIGRVNVDPDYVGSGDYTPQEATLEGTAYPTSIP